MGRHDLDQDNIRALYRLLRLAKTGGIHRQRTDFEGLALLKASAVVASTRDCRKLIYLGDHEQADLYPDIAPAIEEAIQIFEARGARNNGQTDRQV